MRLKSYGKLQTDPGSPSTNSGSVIGSAEIGTANTAHNGPTANEWKMADNIFTTNRWAVEAFENTKPHQVSMTFSLHYY